LRCLKRTSRPIQGGAHLLGVKAAVRCVAVGSQDFDIGFIIFDVLHVEPVRRQPQAKGVVLVTAMTLDTPLQPGALVVAEAVKPPAFFDFLPVVINVHRHPQFYRRMAASRQVTVE
jgi:hypothetical protein